MARKYRSRDEGEGMREKKPSTPPSSLVPASRMLYQTLATCVAVIHFAFIIFVIAGGFLVLRWPALKWVHLPAALWGALIEIGGWICPLTRYENLLRGRAGVAGYGGGFVEHYLLRAMYPAGLTRGIEFAIAATVVTVNI